MISYVKIVFLAMSIGSIALAGPSSNRDVSSSNLAEGYKRTTVSKGRMIKDVVHEDPDGIYQSSYYQEDGSSPGSSGRLSLDDYSLIEPDSQCHVAYMELTGGNIEHYLYTPSEERSRAREESLKDPRSMFDFYGRYVDNPERFPPPEFRWWMPYKAGRAWEKIFSKVYHTLLRLHHDPFKAQELLLRYGCSYMGQALQYDCLEYDKAVVLELLRRRDQDRQASRSVEGSTSGTSMTK